MTINYTHRTPQGHKARILCTDYQNGEFNTISGSRLCTIAAVLDLLVTGTETLVFLTQDLRQRKTDQDPHLTEYNPWQDVAIDTPVWVRDKDSEEWYRLHFSGVHHHGKLCAWSGGRTSHTAMGIMSEWKQMSLTNPNTNSEQS